MKGDRTGGVVRAKRMTVIRPIIGWHQKCWVWLACQMGNSRRTAEASYSRSYGPTDSARELYGSSLLSSLRLFTFTLRAKLGMIRTSNGTEATGHDVNGNRRKIISPRRIRRFSVRMTAGCASSRSQREPENPEGIVKIQSEFF